MFPAFFCTPAVLPAVDQRFAKTSPPPAAADLAVGLPRVAADVDEGYEAWLGLGEAVGLENAERPDGPVLIAELTEV